MDSSGYSEASRPARSLAGFGLGRWVLRTRRAAAFASDGVGLPLVALAGFLLRGGIVAVSLPSIVVPSLLGLASVFGVNALGIDGRPTPWLIATILVACVAAVCWLAVAVLVGSIVDVWLIRSAQAMDPLLVEEPQPLPGVWLVLGMAATRLACMLPLGAAVALAAKGLYDAAYGELTLPSNLGEPLLLRVAARAWAQLALIVVAWLITEAVAAIAVRRLVLGDGIWGSLLGAATQLVRRPISSSLTLVVTAAVSVGALLVAGLATATAFGLCLDAARLPDNPSVHLLLGPVDVTPALAPVAFVGMALILGAAWFASLGVAGVTSAWRSAAWTEETVDAWERARAGELVVLPAEPHPSPTSR